MAIINFFKRKGLLDEPGSRTIFQMISQEHVRNICFAKFKNRAEKNSCKKCNSNFSKTEKFLKSLRIHNLPLATFAPRQNVIIQNFSPVNTKNTNLGLAV
jgi:hypothetical protein